MPRIPDERQMLSPQVEFNTGSIAGAATESLAVAELGASISDIAFGFEKEIKEAEARDAVFQAQSKDLLDLEEFKSSLSQASPDGYARDVNGQVIKNKKGEPKGISEVFYEWSNNRYKSAQKNMPSKLAQDLYSRQMGQYFVQENLKLKSEEKVRKVEYFSANIEKTSNDYANHLTSVPNFDMLYSYSNLLSERLASESKPGGLINPIQAKEKIAAYNGNLARQTMEGSINQVLFESAAGLPSIDRVNQVNYLRSVLAGSDAKSIERKNTGLPTVSDMLKPAEKDDLERRLISLTKTAKDLDKSNYALIMKSMRDAARNGRPVDWGIINQYTSKAQQSGITADEIKQDMANLFSADVEGKATSNVDFMLMDPTSRLKYAEDVRKGVLNKSSSYVGGGDIAQVGDQASQVAYDKLAQLNQKYTKIELNNAADFYEMVPNTPQRKVGTLVNHLEPKSLQNNVSLIQKAIQYNQVMFSKKFPGNEGNFKVMTSKNAKQIVEFLNNQQVSDPQKKDLVNGLSIAYGEHFPSAMNQMIKENKLSERWRWGTLISDPITQSNVIRSITLDPKEVETVFAGKQPSVSAADVRKKVAKKFGAFSEAMLKENPSYPLQSSMVTEFQTAAVVNAMDLVNQGIHSNVDSAIDDVYKTLVEDNVHVKDVKTNKDGGFFSSAPKYKLVVPKKIGIISITDADADLIVKNIEESTAVQNLKSEGLVVPPGADSEKYLEQIAKEGFVTRKQDNTGVQLWFVDRGAAGGDITRVRAQPVLVKDKATGKPKPYVLKFSDLLRPRKAK